MSNYIDGFAFPLSQQHIEKYKTVAGTVAKIYLEHGAIDYVEYIGDDMNREGTRSFPSLVEAKDDEIVIFGWASFDSREHRDVVNKKVETDPRMTNLIAPLVEPSALIFDSRRMAYGGFLAFVQSSS